MGLADLHIHTIHSYDGTATVPAVLAQAKQSGVLQAIGLGATEFPGNTAAQLLDALWIGATDIRQGEQMSSAQILGSWALNFVISAPARIAVTYP